MSVKIFQEEYGKLNKAQKEAVDTTEGPVMVVAGPGTGKTQILALRIANILTKTDTKADSVLCLTFTKSGVKAMRERLAKYIGAEYVNVRVSTFHSFAVEIVEKYFDALSVSSPPKIIDDRDSVTLCDSILEENEWDYIKPRSDTARYFRDLKSLISILKRERQSPEIFEQSILQEIEKIKKDPDNISSRGSTKGEMKKDALRKIESLSRTLEAVKFFSLYEKKKKEKNLFDYDDFLEGLVKIVEVSEGAASDIREQYQYILVDEHQDSSLVQNEFLEAVWGRLQVEKPNIFVVGDDRQLIYGFSGAKLEYFDNFKHLFGQAKLINLIENYRSTENILNLAHSLLQSSLTDEKIKSNHKENHPIKLIEAEYERDEILSASIEIKKKIKEGIRPEEIAVLVPNNRQARNAMMLLRDLGLSVASGEKMNIFDSQEAQAFLEILEAISDSHDSALVSTTFFNPLSLVPPISAHKFLRKNKMRDFSIFDDRSSGQTLFEESDPVESWIKKIKSFIEVSTKQNVYSFLQYIGSDLLLENAKDHEKMISRIEIMRTFLHLALFEMEKNKKLTLKEFISFIRRLESYGEHISMSVFGKNEGVRVLTFHGAKGLEFDFVWIAHLDEKSVSGSGRSGFALPQELDVKDREKDEDEKKRKLYVAITRAKRFCTLSYSLFSYTGGELELANIVVSLLSDLEKQNAIETEKNILASDPKAFIQKKEIGGENVNLKDLNKIIEDEYEDKRVSVSLLNNFFECPWKWYFRNLLELPEPKTESLEFGSLVHGVISELIDMNMSVSEKEVKIIVERKAQSINIFEEKQKEVMIKNVTDIVSRWAKERLPNISKQRESELDVSISDKRFSHLKIYGKIDLVEMHKENRAEVTDFKTGNPRKKSDIEKTDEEGRMSDYMRQLAMYSYLLGKEGKWKKDVAMSRLEFLEATDPKEYFYEIFVDEEKIDLLRRDITDYDRLIKTGEWNERPCHFKSYGKQNASCKYCKMSKIYLV
ncbi:MAG: ATP-dependent DNA helicase [Patescibacteria group bacterium]